MTEISSSQGLDVGEEMNCKRAQGNFKIINQFYILIVVVDTRLNIFCENSSNCTFKIFIICKLFISKTDLKKKTSCRASFSLQDSLNMEPLCKDKGSQTCGQLTLFYDLFCTSDSGVTPNFLLHWHSFNWEQLFTSFPP